MTDETPSQVEAFITPGTVLQRARIAQGLSEREVADQLNLMPGYVAIIERDDYQALRSPAFARGYVKAYGRLVGIAESEILATFDQLRSTIDLPEEKQVFTRPLQLQHTGAGVAVGLMVLLLLVLALWWWQGGNRFGAATPGINTTETAQEVAGHAVPVADS